LPDLQGRDIKMRMTKHGGLHGATLVHRLPAAKTGFTLIELLVVVAVSYRSNFGELPSTNDTPLAHPCGRSTARLGPGRMQCKVGNFKVGQWLRGQPSLWERENDRRRSEHPIFGG